MYAAPFDYFRASSVGEARTLLQQHPGAKVLAGGHSLVPLLKLRLAQPPALVDIGRIAELKGIVQGGGTIRIGALTTHAEIAASPVLRSACPILSEGAALIGDAQVRNLGTIGGNLAHADPASDLPTILVALEARLQIAGASGNRVTSLAEFLQGMMATSLEPDEILTGIEVPARTPGQVMAYVKFSHPASYYAVLGAAVILSVQNGRCTEGRVAVGGLVPAAKRCPAVEAALAGKPATPENATAAAALVARDLGDDLIGDIFASADYRRAMAPVYVERALGSALGRAA